MTRTNSTLISSTPLEQHQLPDGQLVLVKREDLSSPFPGPGFAKIRGVWPHIAARPEPVIGVLDTYHSKAGWAVAQVCQQLGKKCVNFWPRYKADPREGLPREQQQYAQQMGAELVDLPAGRSSVLYHTANRWLHEHHPDSYMMPNALKLPESVEANCEEALATIPYLPASGGRVVISVSSGTVASGVVKAFRDSGLLAAQCPRGASEGWSFWLHMGYSRSHEALRAYVAEKAGLLPEEAAALVLVDEGYGYKDEVRDLVCPFPANPHYDGKAWKWLCNRRPDMLTTKPTLFWNIGA